MCLSDFCKRSNACKYTPVGGEIILSAYHNSSEVSPATIISVRNSSEIPTAALPRIFEKFYRGSNSNFLNQDGTGLGIAIVEKLVEQLQGSIQVESGNEWTTFTLTLNNLRNYHQ
ncbi:sensor histidine kinase [Nostocaceae cyanobacterium CENA369]|uniref:histidine kinase n=1 Tax=Dendronalium phyllosphericum CENA369 TaxID=1725256 RepID=A0A8J7LI46_9NOST|nr:sensor histidine kinase [Dendronalium phyllosphericum]MBH8577871.1 sensor histidine kinase [Dendronalium phyllosphericum CENA369]